jgi:hypothetical protein
MFDKIKSIIIFSGIITFLFSLAGVTIVLPLGLMLSYNNILYILLGIPLIFICLITSFILCPLANKEYENVR